MKSSAEARDGLSRQLLQATSSSPNAQEFCATALRLIERELAAKSLALVHGVGGRWVTFAAVGNAESPPPSLLSETADQDHTFAQRPWIAAPLHATSEPGWLLAMQGTDEALDAVQPHLQSIASVFGCAFAVKLQNDRSQQRVSQLESIVEIAARWHATLDQDKLIDEITRSSTSLFSAERATIFLWNKKKRMLIAKPTVNQSVAIELADMDGVAGRVVKTAEPARVDLDSDHDLVAVEAQVTGLEISSLLCVPIQNRRGKILGAFHLINRAHGSFTAENEAVLLELASHAAAAIENSRLNAELVRTRGQLEAKDTSRVQLVGNSRAMHKLRDKIQRIAATELAVLILGENGTGKEVVSRLIHNSSGRQDQPFVAINCAALTETLLESELFGHEKGAFTDAHEVRAGKFETAATGTLFLDEVGELSQRAQAKLLRVLEDKVVTRVGGTEVVPTDARVIAATNRDLGAMVRDQHFREDLFFRINVVTIEIPPLRDRADDIVPLAEHFLAEFASSSNRAPLPLSSAAKDRLRAHRWPGNIRELRNLMERLAYLAAGDQIEVSDLGPLAGSTGIEDGLALTEATRQFQIEYIEKQIASAGGSMTEAARRLGLHRSNLYRKMRQLGMQDELDEE